MGVAAAAVVRQADHAHPLIPPLPYLPRRQDRVGPLHADQEADRQPGVPFPLLPLPGELAQLSSGGDDDRFPGALQAAVQGELPLPRGVHHLLAAIPRQDAVLAHSPRRDLHQRAVHPSSAHLREAAEGNVGGVGVGGAQLVERKGQVPVETEGIVRHRVVAIENQHGSLLSWSAVIRIEQVEDLDNGLHYS